MTDKLILQRIEETILGFEIEDLAKWYNFDEKQVQSIVEDLERQNIVIREILEGDKEEGEEDLTIYIHKRWYNSTRCESCELLIAADETHVCEGPKTPTFIDE